MSERVDLRKHFSNRTSQSGENGIIEKMFEVIGTRNKVCVDVGAHDLMRLSNVAPLWMDQGWRAILIEGDPGRCARMRRDYTAYQADAERAADVALVEAMAEPQGDSSLDRLLGAQRVPQDPDLISIDVDGTDYHLWASLEEHKPRVVVVEYNNTCPPDFEIVGRKEGNCFGASAKALTALGRAKGYVLVACTPANMVFTLDRYADRFENAGDLDALFDRSGLVFVMRTFDGGVFLSRRPTHGFNPFSEGPERSLADAAPVFFPDKGFRHLIGEWEREMRFRLRDRPIRRTGLVACARSLAFLHAAFSWRTGSR